MFCLKSLREKEIKQLYEERIKKDFHPLEVKPLDAILECLKERKYECFSFFADTKQIGYCFFVKKGNDYLIDYLAIYPFYRNQGYGSELLNEIRKYLQNAGNILLETEDPSYYEGDRKQRAQRRFCFYLRNGFIQTGIRVECFQTHYLLLSMIQELSSEKARDIYSSLYKSILSDEMYSLNLHFEKPGQDVK